MTVVPRKSRALLLALTLALSVGSLPGCAAFKKTPGGQPVPPATQIEQLKQVDQIRQVGEAIVKAVATFQDNEQVLYDLRKANGDRYISPDQHLKIADGLAGFVAKTRPAVVKLRDAAASPQDVRQAAQLLLDAAVDTLAQIAQVTPAIRNFAMIAQGVIAALIIPRL